MTISDVLVLIAVLAIDFALFRTPRSGLGALLIGAAFIGLFVILVVVVWLYVPRKYERRCFMGIYVIYFLSILLCIVNIRYFI